MSTLRPLADLTDQQLLALIDQHRDEVYHEMARRYYQRIHQFLLRMVRRRDVADDLTQDTFAKALQAFQTDPPRRKLWDWIFRIANNTGVDYLRAKRPETVELDHVVDGSSVVHRFTSPDTVSVRAWVQVAGQGSRDTLVLRFR